MNLEEENESLKTKVMALEVKVSVMENMEKEINLLRKNLEEATSKKEKPESEDVKDPAEP
jgi:hypothetical protein